MPQYLFTSQRLGFREWRDTDVPLMAAINADPEVVRYFPAAISYADTAAFIERMRRQQLEKGYCYFAVDILAGQRFIGFIGLSEKTFEASFTPCVDIGWRLDRDEWGKGYATEGAKRCLQYGRNDLKLKFIYAIAPKVNIPSIHIMNKIGMALAGEFVHPMLANDARLRDCALYKAEE